MVIGGVPVGIHPTGDPGPGTIASFIELREQSPFGDLTERFTASYPHWAWPREGDPHLMRTPTPTAASAATIAQSILKRPRSDSLIPPPSSPTPGARNPDIEMSSDSGSDDDRTEEEAFQLLRHVMGPDALKEGGLTLSQTVEVLQLATSFILRCLKLETIARTPFTESGTLIDFVAHAATINSAPASALRV